MSFEDNDLERLAKELHEEWDSPSLWPRIQAEISPVRKPTPWWQFAMAAAAVLALGVALVQLWPRPAAVQQSDAAFLTRETLREVEESEAAYVRSINKLAALAGPSLQNASTPLAAAYREKLLLIDQSIAELKTHAEDNTYNVYLRTQLASLYHEKQSTLEEWLKNAKSN